MKLLYAGSLMLLLLACSAHEKPTNTPPSGATEALPAADSILAIPSAGPQINIPYLKACGSRGISGFDADRLKLPSIPISDSTTLNRLQNQLIQPSTEWRFRTTAHEPAYCHQWEEQDGYFYFTLLQDDEVCCRSVYIGKTDSRGQLLAFTLLGLRGGDGYWYRQDSVEKVASGRFILHQHNYQDEDIIREETPQYQQTHTYYRLELNLTKDRLSLDTLQQSQSDSIVSVK